MRKILSLMLIVLLALPGAQAGLLHGGAMFNAISSIVSYADSVSSGGQIFIQKSKPCHDAAAASDAVFTPAQTCATPDTPCPQHGTCHGTCAHCAACHLSVALPGVLIWACLPADTALPSRATRAPAHQAPRLELRPPIAA
ncbi:MAG: hypothetical protein Fur007_17890 [Rhodoferax sp.]